MTRAIGPGAGSAAGWGLVLGYLFTGIACVVGFEIYGDNLLVGFGLSSPANHVVRGILYVVGGLAPAIMAVSDIKISQRLAFILEAVSVTIILILCIAVYVHNGGVIDTHQLSLKGASDRRHRRRHGARDLRLRRLRVGGRARPGGEEPGPLACPARSSGPAASSACST